MSSDSTPAPAPVSPTPTAAPRRERPPKPAWREWLEAALFAVLVTQFVATLVGVNGASMMPTLRHGERLLVPKYEPWLHKIGVGDFQRGDIVIFKPPAQAGTVPALGGLWQYRPFLVKRLVAVGGDRVRVTEGRVFVNDQEIAQNFATDYWQAQGCWDTGSAIANNASAGFLLPAQEELTVPAGHYFVMGDNRHVSGSNDSRSFGAVPLRDLAGRAVASVWPIVRAENMDYDCASADPARDAVPRGPQVLNWRTLPRPPAFEEFNASPAGTRRTAPLP